MAYKPYTEKSFLYSRYVEKSMTINQIADECTKMGYKCTPMTVYNHLKKHNLIQNSRNLGQRSFGGNEKGKGKGGSKGSGKYYG